MTNSIENLFEQISEKQLYRVWSRVRRYADKHRKRSYQTFQFCHFLEDINLSFDQKSFDEDSQSELYKSYDCTRNEFRIHRASYECRMQ